MKNLRRISARAPTFGLVLVLFAALLQPSQSSEAADGGFSVQAEAMREAARRAGIPEHELPLETPEESRLNKAKRAPWENKLTSAVRHVLTVMTREGATTGERRSEAPQYSTATVSVDYAARMLVECRVDRVQPFDADYFASIGGVLVDRAVGYGYLVAWIPADQLPAFASREDVRLVRHIDPPYTDIGAVDTEGDGIHNADDARDTFGIDGSGQLVGVISDGVSNYTAAQGTNDLPADEPADPGINIPGGCAGSGDEGTAMLEIVHDLAPGADLAFCTGFPGTTGMVNAINTLAALPGITVITDDLPKPEEPVFEDGPIAQAKQAAEALGIFYTASAGNRGNQHYQGDFNGTADDVVIGGNTYNRPHDFGGGDYQMSVTSRNCGSPPCSNTVYLQWNELYGTANIDLDLFILDNAGNVLASSTTTQNGDDDPAETATATVAPGTALRIVVDYVGGDPPAVFLDLRSFHVTGWEYLVRAGSINGASRQPEVYAAGAANWTAPGTINGFSSRGPIRRYFPSFVERIKPDGTAVDGVSVTGAGCFACPNPCPPSINCNFSGTSASTPHVAGLAALLLENQSTLTPTEVADTFNATAVDIDAPGQDNNSGWGRLDVHAAICSFDETPPEITCPDDVLVECQGDEGIPASELSAFLDGAEATDECTDDPEITNDAPGFFMLGDTVVEFTATDPNGNEATCTATVTVEDTTPPDVFPPDPVTLECNGPGGIDVNDPDIQAWLDEATAEDACYGDIPDVLNDAPGLFPSGCAPGNETTVTFEATDGAGNTGSAQSSVTVQDTTEPMVNCDVAVDTLWPVNHKFVDVGLTYTATDVCDTGSLAVEVTVTSDEDPLNASGAGGPIHCPDAQIDGTNVALRAERSGSGDGRVYEITVSATDNCGNVGTCTVSVGVPKSRRPGSTPVDSGQGFDATMCDAGIAAPVFD
jgi:hypothetical protein